MSQSNNYANPLDNYRSFSYHYVITAGQTTDALKKILEAAPSQAGTSNTFLSTIAKKKLGDQFDIGGEKAYLVLDTRRFAQYSVTSLEMSHAYGTGSKTNPSVPTGAMKMQLIDTTGLSFFNFLMDLFRNKMETSISSSFFLLSILFVGHKDNGETETVSMINTVVLMTSMGFTFTHKGSEFDIEFVELQGAPQKSPTYQQLNSLGDVKVITTARKSGSNTLGELIDDLENNLNIKSMQYYAKFKNQASAKGKLVQYMITIPNEGQNNWAQMKVTGAARSTNVEQRFKAEKISGTSSSQSPTTQQADIARGSVYSQITFADTTSIPDAIKIILESSDEFLKLSSLENRRTGKAKSFRIVTSITSDNDSYIVHFDVYPYYLPKLTEEKDTVAAGQTKKAIGTTGSIIKNKIEYDYLFTGMNSHITDLKIQYSPDAARAAIDNDVTVGFFRFASNAQAGQKISDVKEASKGGSNSVNFTALIKPNDPVFVPVRTADQKDNNATIRNEALSPAAAQQSIKTKQDYSLTYAMLHFIGSLSLEMSIRGNPKFLEKFSDKSSIGSLASHPKVIKDTSSITAPPNGAPASDAFVSQKQAYISSFIRPKIQSVERSAGTDALLSGPDIAVMPIFVKVNIKAPSVDWTGAFNDNELFTDKFFFNGYYQLLTITSTLANGEFSQVMQLMPYDLDSAYSTSNDSK